jgi:hypothetical protein
MRKKTSRTGVLIAIVFIIASAQNMEARELLTVEDVEGVTGIQDLKLVPKNPVKGAGGDLNFAQQDEELILMVNIQDRSMYETWKSQEGYFHADVPDVGDEAFEGPSFGEVRYILVFRKGGKTISLSSFINMEAGGDPFLSQDQLRELANIMVSRL